MKRKITLTHDHKKIQEGFSIKMKDDYAIFWTKYG